MTCRVRDPGCERAFYLVLHPGFEHRLRAGRDPALELLSRHFEAKD